MSDEPIILEAGEFEKYASEQYVIAFDFSDNMNIPTENLQLSNTDVKAYDAADNDVTLTVVDAPGRTIGSGAEQGYLKVLVRAGTIGESPIKLVGTTGETDATPAQKFQKNVYMTIVDP